MDKNVLKRLRTLRKPFTKELVEGWHKKDIEDIDVFYGRCLKYILKSLEEKGFYFDGVERVSPLEFFDKITRGSGSSLKEFESTKNSFFGVKIKSHFIDPVTKEKTTLKEPHVFLPFTNVHGDCFVRNSLYSLQLVLSERGPSVDGVKDKTIFIRMLTFKSKITAEPFDIYKIRVVSINNIQQLPLNVKLSASRFYNSKEDRRVKEKETPLPLLAWYVFSTYGFKTAMEKYAECEYRIDSRDVLIEECKEKDGWEIVENGNAVHPKCLHKYDYLSVEPAIAIRTYSDSDVNTLPFQYASSFLFAVAAMGGRFEVNRIDDFNYWRLIIGYCSMKLPNSASEETYLRQMDEHVSSVAEYADPFTVDRWKKSNIKIEDTSDLFNYVITHHTEIIKTYNPANLLHKELACKEFLLENLIRAANDFKFKLRNKPNLRPSTIEREMDSEFNLFRVDPSIRSNNSILEQTGSDNPFIDYGLGIIRQTKATVSRSSNTKKNEFNPNHPGSLIHASQTMVVSFQYATGPHPAGDAMLTPRVCLKNGRYTALHDSDVEIYRKTVRRLKYGK